MNCLHCGATTHNGLALCQLCQRKASTCLEFLPAYIRNLSRWRPGRAGSRPVPGSRVLYDGTVRGSGTGDRISDALDETATTLTTWARVLVENRPDFPRPLTLADAALCDDLPDELAEDRPFALAWLCVGLEHHLTGVATLDWCGEFVRDISTHEARLRALTETWMPGWYAGACTRRISMEQTCGAPTYVAPGLTWVTCRACGSTTYARDHLETILGEACDWIARPKALAEAIVALVDTEQSVPRLHERIKKWGHRERISAVWRTERGHEWIAEEGRYAVVDQVVGYPRYRLGEVLDVLFAEGATRLGGQSKTPAV